MPIKCPKCQTENPEKVNYGNECATELTQKSVYKHSTCTRILRPVSSVIAPHPIVILHISNLLQPVISIKQKCFQPKFFDEVTSSTKTGNDEKRHEKRRRK